MSPLTDADRARLTAQLSELQAAYDRLISGPVISVGSGSRTVGYGKGDAVALMARIAAIKRQLGIGGGRISLTPYF
ncbi:gpW family head-tail joining protein [Magnetospirillum fulvum]|uniref:Uncharacterized protein n=1 Tax=Magnetospirillum fulvum MGU-K5 TaxID=1316936 RepID=S9SBC1_MAGFU|nr:gpW family head-tail joining protein [Magnetospirillum fulvum]EPY01393.1 hypothetical protein K678_11366 [Magnetospirillum fulvum MGU-K5]